MKVVKNWMKKINLYFKEDKRTFAKGICGYKLFLIFVVGSIFGTYYEQILNLVKYYFRYHTIFWEYRRGVIYGPFSPVYGAGAVLITYFLVKKKDKWYVTFFKGALLGGSFEYLINWLQEVFVKTVSWDYSHQLLNINGRTTVPIMMIWGLLGVVFVKVVYPILSKGIERVPYRIGEWVTKTLIVLLAVDMLISWTALIRQTFRRVGIGPWTPIGEIYDRVYNDEFLKKRFPNMIKR